MSKLIREARPGFAFAGVGCGLLGSTIGPIGRHFGGSDGVTGAIQALLICSAVVLAIVAFRQLRRSA
jgi:hypothetical protein